MALLKYEDTEKRPLIVEIDGPRTASALQEAGLRDIALNAVATTHDALREMIADSVQFTVESFEEALSRLPTTPSSVEISFGLKITGEGNVAIGKVGAESNYGVKLTWTDDRSRRTDQA
jgi:hypothetical protein